MSPGPDSGSTILVVDDNGDQRDTLAELLGMAGYRVACAANGREALAYLRNNPPPRLILLDLRMPLMSGWEFRAEQRRDPLLAGIPVLVLSGGADLHGEVAGLDAAGYLVKPTDITLLLAAIAPYFGRATK
jgi:CheY-like chemotaxis protein